MTLNIDKIIDDYVSGGEHGGGDKGFVFHIYGLDNAGPVKLIDVCIAPPSFEVHPVLVTLVVSSINEVCNVIRKESAKSSIKELDIEVYYIGEGFLHGSLSSFAPESRADVEDAAKEVCKELKKINKVDRCVLKL